MTAYERLCAARDQNRPTAIEYIRRMFGESFLELHGDRRYGDDKAVLAGIASLNGMPLTVIALERVGTSRSAWPAISAPHIRRATVRLCA